MTYFWAALLTPILTEFVLLALTRLFPLAKNPDFEFSLEDLRKEFLSWEFFFVASYIVFAGILLFVSSKLFPFFAHRHYGSLGEESVYFIAPSAIVYALPALLLSLIWAAPLASLLMHLLLRGNRSERWEAYLHLRWKEGAGGYADINHAFYSCSVALTALALLFLVLGMNTYTRFERDKITLDRYWSLSAKTYSYAEIKQISFETHFKAPNGRLVKRPHLKIQFEDGSQWKSIDMPWEKVSTYHTWLTDEKLARFLSERSGNPIQSKGTTSLH
jgi:hypothetical protein